MLLIKLAWRSLLRNKRRTLITVISIALGTGLALFFISLQLGVYEKMIDEAVRMNAGHLTVEHGDYELAPSIDLFVSPVTEISRMAEGIEGVEQVKPLVVGQAMVSTSAGAVGVGLVGVNPEAEAAASPLAEKIIDGRYLKTGDERGVVVGARLAERLKLKLGKKMVVTTNDVSGELVSELLRLTGVFEVGTEETDAFLIQVPIDVARRIFRLGPDAATRVGVVLESPKYQEEVIEQLRTRISDGDMSVLPWQEVMPDLAGFIAIDVGSNYVFQGIIIFIIGFTILNTILMSVLERSREFATLLAIGTSPMRLRIQVAIESAFIGLIGTVCGLLLGSMGIWYMMAHGWDLSGIYGDSTTVSGYLMDPVLRGYASVNMFLILGTLIFGMTLLLGLYPAYKSARISIPDVLRTH